MRRISNEDGINAGVRNIGRYALAAIPAALGGAACLWIMAASGCLDLGNKINTSRRSFDAVGMTALPTEPITLVLINAQCLQIEKAFIDADTVITYVKNACDRWLKSPNYHYQTQAADSTVILSGRWAFSGVKSIGPGERREQRVWLDGRDYVELDPRTVKIVVSVLD